MNDAELTVTVIAGTDAARAGPDSHAEATTNTLQQCELRMLPISGGARTGVDRRAGDVRPNVGSG